MYMPAFASWGYPLQWYTASSNQLTPFHDRKVYDKPVIILANAGTFSAAEDFCSVFKGMKRGLVFGTPTGGSTGNGVRMELIPGKSYANICSKHDTCVDGTDFVGVGIQPDKEIRETYASYFQDKYDAVLTRALEEITRQ
jgi:carboxyl-terminal processing protease